ALFTTRPLDAVRSITADTSSRTSHALLKILCVERFGIEPDFQPMPPDPEAMLHRCDAALLIGDPALLLDHERLGANRIDLGDEWKALTHLPFVWASWAGRRDALSPEAVQALIAARDRGVMASDDI